MKKVLQWVMVALAVLLVALYLISETLGSVSDLILGVGGVLLLGVFCAYALHWGGIRCHNCGCRVNPKYGRSKSFEGRFPCPKCGAMIEL